MARKKAVAEAQEDEPYADPPDRHRHKCFECGSVWDHADSCADLPRFRHVKAHKCPGCGEVEYLIYTGDDPPDYADHDGGKK